MRFNRRGTLAIGAISSLVGPSIAYPSPSSSASAPSPSQSSQCGTSLARAEPLVVESAPGVWPWLVFHSSPINPPEFAITTSGAPLSPGLIFIDPSDFTPLPAVKQPTPFIMTDTGDLVWASTVENVTDFRVQILDGKPYLTFWSGFNSMGADVGHGYGSVTFLDTTYNQAYRICPQLGLITGVTPEPPCQIDIHEHQLTDSGTMLVSAYSISPTDLTSIGGPVNGYALDCLVFEVDVKTSAVLFRWSSLEHVPVSASHQPLVLNATRDNGTFAAPFDYFHINSAVAVGDNYLINSRHTFSMYLVNKRGDILWELNGKTGGDFGPLPPNGTFSWQHHARVRNLTDSSITISMFNDHNSETDNGTHPSSGLELTLALPPSQVSATTTVAEYLTVAREEVYADSQGSYELMDDGHQFIGWGEIPIMREFGPASNGSDFRWEARFGVDDLVQNYRSFKHEWHATPATQPNVAVVAGNASAACSGSVGYVSWNGATDVTGWNVYGGGQADQLALVGYIAKAGFETAFNVASNTPCVQVGAIQGGHEIRRSKVTCS